MASYDPIQLELIKLEQLCQLSLKINSVGLILDRPAAISVFAASATPAQLDKWNSFDGSKNLVESFLNQVTKNGLIFFSSS